MIALSIRRQPWAWLILNAGKDIENRSWPTQLRGRILIHAPKTMTRAEYECATDRLWARGGPVIDLPAFETLPLGGIVGSAEIVDLREAKRVRVLLRPFGFVLRRPARPLPFRRCRGALGVFNVPEAQARLAYSSKAHKKYPGLGHEPAEAGSTIT